MESTVKVPKTCDEMRDLIGQFLKRGDSEAQRLWDIITCQRGPDHPSEDGTMANNEASEAYQARRKRKRDTVEVIRAKSWGGVVGGAARFRTDIDYVTVEPPNEQDHFARHVVKAASALGLEVKYKKPKSEKGLDVPVKVGYSGETSAQSAKYAPPPKPQNAVPPPFPAWTLEVNPKPLMVKNIAEATKAEELKKNPDWKGPGVYIVKGLTAFSKQVLFMKYAETGDLENSHQLTEGSTQHTQWMQAFTSKKWDDTKKKIMFSNSMQNKPTKEVSSSPF